jgi:hypothetical protein
MLRTQLIPDLFIAANAQHIQTFCSQTGNSSLSSDISKPAFAFEHCISHSESKSATDLRAVEFYVPAGFADSDFFSVQARCLLLRFLWSRACFFKAFFRLRLFGTNVKLIYAAPS